MSIRARLTLTVVAATVALAVAGTLLFAWEVRHRVAAETDDDLRVRIELVAALVRANGPRVPVPAASMGDDAVYLAQVVAPDGSIASSAGIDRPLLDGPDVDRARTGMVVLDGYLDPDGEREIRILAQPVATADGTAVVAVAQTLKPAHDILADYLPAALAIAGAAVGLAGAGAWIVAGAALAPVEQLRRQAAALSGDEGGHLAVPVTGDELARLAVTFNELLDGLHAALRRERHLVADAAHELRTPLAALSAELELADRPQRDEHQLRTAILSARHDTDRLTRLAEDLLFLARSGDHQLHPTMADQPIAETVERAVAAVSSVVPDAGPRLHLTARGNTTAGHDPGLLERAVQNVVANAVHHAAGAERVDVLVDGSDPAAVTVTVTDDGPGFPEAFLPHAFERFRRADDARSGDGTGLGLAIAQAIIAAHHGAITAANATPTGAVVTLTLPRRPPTR